MMVRFRCLHCSRPSEKRKGQRNVYCGKRCSGLARRTSSTDEERRALKAAYDREYRERNRDKLKQSKAEYNHQNYDPSKARAKREQRKRKLGAHHHRDYCRQWFAAIPARKDAKRAYDLQRRAAQYGPFADCYIVLLDLHKEIRRREPSIYQRLKARGYYENKRTAQERKRDAKISRW